MPSCIQNAMMTKDKKPFTYTPCGIDLSQIKSPRMAQRLQRNANMEGVTNQPKPSPVAQVNISTASTRDARSLIISLQLNNQPAVPRAPVRLPNTHMTPVQVLPPPMPQAKLKPHTESRSPSLSRKSPQVFEPPPLGCRPEIKIPPNPMASLRKVPSPKPKDDFWVEEYRKEQSRSPKPESVTNSETNSDVRPEVETASVTTEDSSGIVSNMTDNESTSTPVQSESPLIKSPRTPPISTKIESNLSNGTIIADQTDSGHLSPRPTETRYRTPSPVPLIQLRKEKEDLMPKYTLPAPRQFTKSPQPDRYEPSPPVYQQQYQQSATPTRTFNRMSPQPNIYESSNSAPPMQSRARSPQPYVPVQQQPQPHFEYKLPEPQPNRNISACNDSLSRPHQYAQPEPQRTVRSDIFFHSEHSTFYIPFAVRQISIRQRWSSAVVLPAPELKRIARMGATT